MVSSIKSNSRRKCTQTIPTSRPKPRRFDTQSYYLRGRPGIITYSLSWNGDSTRPPLSHRLRSNVIIEKNNSSACSHVSFDLLSSKKIEQTCWQFAWSWLLRNLVILKKSTIEWLVEKKVFSFSLKTLSTIHIGGKAFTRCEWPSWRSLGSCVRSFVHNFWAET